MEETVSTHSDLGLVVTLTESWYRFGLIVKLSAAFAFAFAAASPDRSGSTARQTSTQVPAYHAFRACPTLGLLPCTFAPCPRFKARSLPALGILVRCWGQRSAGASLGPKPAGQAVKRTSPGAAVVTSMSLGTRFSHSSAGRHPQSAVPDRRRPGNELQGERGMATPSIGRPHVRDWRNAALRTGERSSAMQLPAADLCRATRSGDSFAHGAACNRGGGHLGCGREAAARRGTHHEIRANHVTLLWCGGVTMSPLFRATSASPIGHGITSFRAVDATFSLPNHA